MGEKNNAEQRPKDNGAPPHGLLGNDLINQLKDLKARCKTQGDGHIDLKAAAALAALYLLIGWWCVSFLIMMLKARGLFVEGEAGFIMKLIYRMGFTSFGIYFLVWYRKKYVSGRHSLGWWIGAACLAAVIFLCLRNPVRDIPFLFHPKTVILESWETRWDASGEYSSLFQIVGDSADGRHMSFYINRSSYDVLHDQSSIIRLSVEYLPYTKSVISYRLQL